MSSAISRIGIAAFSLSLVTMFSLPARASLAGFSADASVQAGEVVISGAFVGFGEICQASAGGSGFAAANTSGTLGFTQTGTTAFGLPFGLFDCGGSGGGQTIGFGSASADLPSGSLRAFSSATGPFGNALGLSFVPLPIEVKAGASLSDMLTFSVPAALTNNPDCCVFSVMMTVTGSLNGDSQVTACDGANCMTQSSDGTVNLQIPQFYPISNGSVVNFNARLNVQSIGGMFGVLSSSANFGDTAAITFQLPAGVTFTSASGEFLSAPPGGVTPEPATLSLLGLGLSSVGFALRRKLRPRVDRKL